MVKGHVIETIYAINDKKIKLVAFNLIPCVWFSIKKDVKYLTYQDKKCQTILCPCIFIFTFIITILNVIIKDGESMQYRNQNAVLLLVIIDMHSNSFVSDITKDLRHKYEIQSKGQIHLRFSYYFSAP